MVTPAAAADRNYVNNQNYNNQSYSRGYVAPAPAPARFDRDAQVRLDQRVREQRVERERNEHARFNVRYVRSLRDGC
jgi:hypothetical protein